jgi:hypothetical protein
MATTTNYGWTTPDDTALVKDGAAAIRTLGSSVDTTTKALNPSTTLGDIEYRSSTANTNTRLGIGTTGQVLTVAGGVPSWATSAGGSANWSLLNAGGTALTGASTITVSGISGKDKIMVLVESASTVSTGVDIYIRLNGDSGGNYTGFGGHISFPSSYAATSGGRYSATAATGIWMAQQSSNTDGHCSGSLLITGCNSSGVKAFQCLGGAENNGGGSAQRHVYHGGVYNSATVISSISLFAGANFDNGTVYVYTSV